MTKETDEQKATRASIVAYLDSVAEEQAKYERAAELGSTYRGRMAMRAFMARALAKRVARGEDLRQAPAPIEGAT